MTPIKMSPFFSLQNLLMKVLAAKTVEKCTVTLHPLLVILSTSAIQVLKTFYFLHEVFKQRTKLKAIFFTTEKMQYSCACHVKSCLHQYIS